MPTAWENHATRSKIRQAVLGGVLGLSVLLSWVVVRAHHLALVPKEWKSAKVGTFSLQIPASWNTDNNTALWMNSVTATEPKPYLEITRKVKVETRKLFVAGNSQEYAESYDPRATAELCQPFEFLGQKGVIAELPIAEVMMRRQGRPRLAKARLMAVVVLPKGVAVVVELTGSGPGEDNPGLRAFSLADRDLLETVARSMKDDSAAGTPPQSQTSQ